MKSKWLFVLAMAVLIAFAATTAWAAPEPGGIVQPNPAEIPPPPLTTTIIVNVVFVGYEMADIDETDFSAELPTTYDPIVRYPAFYGIPLPVNIHGDYAFNYTYAPTSFEDAFFGYIASIGTAGPLTVFQEDYNAQIHKSLTISGDVLYIDAPKTERWLMNHARSDLGLDVANYTIFFVNWYSRGDFQYHVYTKTSFADPDTGYNFGEIRGSRKMIAWGGTYGRTWFYDLSAGPEAWTDNWNVDDADVDGDGVLDYRMPPVWEYGNVSGYRPFDNLSGDLGKVARWVAINLLFTSSPLYDPLATEPYPGKGKTVDINMFEDDVKNNGLEWLDTEYVQTALSMFEPQYPWKVKTADHKLNGDAKKAFRQWAEINLASGCWNDYGTRFAELYCFFDENRDQYLNKVKPAQNYIGGVFAFNTKLSKMGPNAGLLGYADDDWLSGTPTYVFAFDTPYLRNIGYGFSTTVVHEFGHHVGMSHPHDGYDSTFGLDYGPSGDYYFAWSGDESETIMAYNDLTGNFGWFDRDNMNRFMAGRYLTRASEIAARVSQADPSGSRALLDEANNNMEQARIAFRQNDWEGAANRARAAFQAAFRASENAGLNLPITKPLTGGGPFRGVKPVDPIHPHRDN
jgi:hypothetical protein